MRTVKRFLGCSLMAVFLTGCSSLDSLLYEPAYTPAAWLEWQPHARVWFGGREWVLTQPLSTLYVYLLGAAAIILGIMLFRQFNENNAELIARAGDHRWWGAALVLWGAGALAAGTSYELFSYEIKCAGYEFCRWTSWWEIIYLLLSLGSINAMAAAQAVRLQIPLKKRLQAYAAVNTGLYIMLVIIGTAVPVRFLISFEMLILFAAPTIALFLWINGVRREPERTRVDQNLLWIWIGLIVVIGAYFAYYMLGWTDLLWQQGIWFSENDVLHLGLIGWMLAIFKVLSVDNPENLTARPDARR